MQPELIETILVDAERRVPLLARHLHRLEHSCKALGYTWGGNAVQSDIMIAALSLNTPGAHRLRLLVARDGSRHIQTAVLPPLPAARRRPPPRRWVASRVPHSSTTSTQWPNAGSASARLARWACAQRVPDVVAARVMIRPPRRGRGPSRTSRS